jgi:hypothetical protein
LDVVRGRQGDMKRPSSVISLDDECEGPSEANQSASTTVKFVTSSIFLTTIKGKYFAADFTDLQ